MSKFKTCFHSFKWSWSDSRWVHKIPRQRFSRRQYLPVFSLFGFRLMWLLMSIQNQSDTQVFYRIRIPGKKLAFYSGDQTRNSFGIWADKIERDPENVQFFPSRKLSFIFSITSRITFLYQYINLFLDYPHTHSLRVYLKNFQHHWKFSEF